MMDTLIIAAEKMQEAEQELESTSHHQQHQQHQHQPHKSPSYTIVSKLYGCGVCSTFKPSKRNNVEQHIWQKHSEQHGGDSHVEKYRASKHKQIVAPFLRPVHESEVAASRRPVVAEPLSVIVPRLPAANVHADYVAKAQGYNAAIISPPTSAHTNDKYQYMDYDAYYRPPAGSAHSNLYNTPPMTGAIVSQEPYTSVSPPTSATYAVEQKREYGFSDPDNERIAYARQRSYPAAPRRSGYMPHSSHHTYGPAPYPFHSRGSSSHHPYRSEHHAPEPYKKQSLTSPYMNVQSSPAIAGLERDLQGLLRPGDEEDSPQALATSPRLRAGWSSPARYERMEDDRLSPEAPREARRSTMDGYMYSPAMRTNSNLYGSSSADAVDMRTKPWAVPAIVRPLSPPPARSYDSITHSPNPQIQSSSSASSFSTLSAQQQPQVFTFSPATITNDTSPRPTTTTVNNNTPRLTVSATSTTYSTEADEAFARDQMLIQAATGDAVSNWSQSKKDSVQAAAAAVLASPRMNPGSGEQRLSSLKQVLLQLEHMGAIEIRRPEKWSTSSDSNNNPTQKQELVSSDSNNNNNTTQKQESVSSASNSNEPLSASASNDRLSTPSSADSIMWRPF